MGNFDRPENFVKMASNFGGWVETQHLIVDGNKIAHAFVLHMSSPVGASTNTCDTFELKDEKIHSLVVYNNPADLPRENPAT